MKPYTRRITKDRTRAKILRDDTGTRGLANQILRYPITSYPLERPTPYRYKNMKYAEAASWIEGLV